MLLKVNTDNKTSWAQWSRHYAKKGKGIPIVYVVRADGQQLYGQSGAPERLSQFLNSQLKQAGRILSPKEQSQLEKNVGQAQAYLKKQNIQSAVLRLARSANTGSYSASALTADKLAVELTEKGMAALKEAEEKLDSKDKVFDGALALVETARIYGRLRAMKKPVRMALAARKKNTEQRQLITQAKMVDAGKVFEGKSKWMRALSAYRRIEKKYPNSPAAEFAAIQIKELEKKTTSVAKVARPKSDAQPTSASTSKKKAASTLRLAKLLLKKGKRNKARDYLEKVIKLAPDSPPAKEATELLKTF